MATIEETNDINSPSKGQEKNTEMETSKEDVSSLERLSSTKDDDEVGSDVPRISQPSQFDVLFGRGKPYQGHAGNIRLHKIVDLYKPRYSQARRHEKTEIAEEIVQFIKTPTNNNKPGRFLKRVENEEAWVEVSDSVARDKVSHALRGKPRKESESSGVALTGLTGSKRESTENTMGDATTGLGINRGPEAKRPKLEVSDLDLLATRRNHAFMGAGATVGARSLIHHHHEQQLLASALAERQLAAGMAPPFMGRMGIFAPHHHSLVPGGAAFRYPMIPAGLPAGEMNPLLLHQLAAERQFRADPRFWM